MPRYAPLPSVSIDPRNEAQIVQDASQRVYQASNQTLNDFSAGNPLAALIEGQAFAQGEFLFWANQLPDKILLEWIGPFLGALRRLGTPSVARVVFTVDPSNQPILIPAGSRIGTDSNLTGGETFSFLLDQDVTIPVGETSAFGSVTSEYVGSLYNVPAGSISAYAGPQVDGLSVINPQPAIGASNVETYRQAQERFFTLIRRKNPVSEADWQNFFIDLYGLGTLTAVQPSRPTPYSYNYTRDYSRSNGHVSFFVLGPNGIELTDEQLIRGQNVVNFSVPLELQGHLYPFSLSEVQYNLTVEVDANGPFGGDFKNSSLSFRDRLFNILTPGLIFPATNNPSVGEVDAAFNQTFSADTRYVDPNIVQTVAYNTPEMLDQTSATYAQVYQFRPVEYLLEEDDLVLTTLPTATYYPVLQSFNPYSSSKRDQTIYGNLKLKQIKLLQPGNFLQGDVVVSDDNGVFNLRVILENLSISSSLEIPGLIAKGKISSVKTYSSWTTGNSYVNNVGGVLNPDLVQYDYMPGEFVPPGSFPTSKRPGTLIWFVNKNFTLQPATNDLTGALAEFKLGSPVTPAALEVGATYNAGTWIQTPQVGSGPSQEIDPNYYYVDISKGAVTKTAYVITTFTYEPADQTTSSYFDDLVTQGIIKEITVRNGDAGLPIYYYKPRFQMGDYLLYKDNVSDSPSYYVATEFFTPNSNRIEDILEEGLVIPLAMSMQDQELFDLQLAQGTVQMPKKMFAFFKGEQTYFRNGVEIKAYVARENVTPLFEFYVYLRNGVFEPVSASVPEEFITNTVYVPYYNPTHAKYAEDIVIAENGKSVYRVMRAFVPQPTVTGWSGLTVTNTCRLEEYAGNLLRIVRAYSCQEKILSQQGNNISSIKLGPAQIRIIPKNTGRTSNANQQYIYVWENTNAASEVPELSWFTGSLYAYTPPNYRNGTLSL